MRFRVCGCNMQKTQLGLLNPAGVLAVVVPIICPPTTALFRTGVLPVASHHNHWNMSLFGDGQLSFVLFCASDFCTLS